MEEVKYCVFVPLVLATYGNPIVAFICLFFMYLLIKPFFVDHEDD
jgi:hypothetical protein